MNHILDAARAVQAAQFQNLDMKTFARACDALEATVSLDFETTATISERLAGRSLTMQRCLASLLGTSTPSASDLAAATSPAPPPAPSPQPAPGAKTRGGGWLWS